MSLLPSPAQHLVWSSSGLKVTKPWFSWTIRRYRQKARKSRWCLCIECLCCWKNRKGFLITNWATLKSADLSLDLDNLTASRLLSRSHRFSSSWLRMGRPTRANLFSVLAAKQWSSHPGFSQSSDGGLRGFTALASCRSRMSFWAQPLNARQLSQSTWLDFVGYACCRCVSFANCLCVPWLIGLNFFTLKQWPLCRLSQVMEACTPEAALLVAGCETHLVFISFNISLYIKKC